MSHKFSHICFWLIASVISAQASTFDFYTFWAQPGELSPDGRLIHGSGNTLYDSQSLEPRYHFNDSARGYFANDGAQYVYHNMSTGLRRYTFATGVDESLVDLSSINNIYRSPDTRSFLFTTNKISEINGKDITEIYSKLDGKPLMKLASFQAETLEELYAIEIESHPDEDIVLFEVREYSRPTTPMGNGTYGPRKIYELNIRTKALNLVVEWPGEFKGSLPRPIAAGSDTYEYTSEGSYILFNPKTGEISRKLTIPNVKFHLEKVGEVEAKRTVTENGTATHFLDILASGTLKTIRNIPQDAPAEKDWGRKVNVHGQSPEHVWFIDYKTLTQVDAKSWTALNTYKIPVSWPKYISYSADKPGYLVLLDGGDFYNYHLETQRSEILNQGPKEFTLSNLSFHPTEPEFYGLGDDGNVNRFRITQAGLSRANLGKGPESFSISKDGKTVFFMPDSESWLRRSDLKSFPRGESIEYEAPYPNSVLPNYNLDNIYTDTAKYLIQVDSFFSYLHDYQSGKFIAKIEEHGRGDYSAGMISHPISFALAPDDSAFVSLQTDSEYSMETREASVVTRLSYTKITEGIQDFPEPDWSVVLDRKEHTLLDFTKDGSGILVFDHISGELLDFSTVDGSRLNKQQTEFSVALDESQIEGVHSYYGIRYDRDKRLLMHKPTDSKLQVLSLNGSIPALKTMQFDTAFNGWQFLADSGYIKINSASGSAINLYRYDSDLSVAPVGQLTFYNGGDDYLFAGANGQFDATQPVVDGVLLEKEFTYQPLSQIFEQKYEPALLQKSFAAIELADADSQLEAVVIPPEASMSSRNTSSSTQIELTINVSAPQHEIERYDLFLNDKLIRTNYAPTYNEKLVVDLLPETNVFQLIAVDVKGISSSPATVAARPPEAFINEQLKRTSERRLHILAVGIDDYTNPQHKLNYAVADASAVLERLESLNAEIFDSVQTTLITNSEANKDGIMAAFARISNDASAQDTFVFYFAGHGVLSQEDSNFYLVPQDAVQIYGADSSLSKKGISSQKLRELSSQVKARKQLFILDACNSAGALVAFKERGASQEKAIAQLARSTGTHWIAASSGDQFATEFAELGHGAFTYTLLKGLSGEADSGDKRITINEIKAYVESMLPEVTKTYKGRPQYPASYGVGQDFPIALIP